MPRKPKVKQRDISGITKLNLGCGTSIYKDFVNVDFQPFEGVDLSFDISEPNWPIEDNKFDTVWLIHTIEHIIKKKHSVIFAEVNRILKEGGEFYLAYPEFSEIAKNWMTNKKGMRDFWEKTIYGRQLTPTDFHVCAMDTVEVVDLLLNCGFSKINKAAEPNEDYNTMIKAVKKRNLDSKETILAKEVCNV